MKTLKKILFPVFSLFLIYRSYDLMKDLINSEPEKYGSSETFILSFLLSLFITGVFAISGFAYKTNKILPKLYYEVRNPEFLNFIYDIMGVRYFRVMLMIAFWGRKKNRLKYFDGTKKGLENFIFQTKQSEFGHLSAFVSIIIISVVLLFHEYYQLVVFLTIFNVIGNFYPIILQRKHRIRIEKIIH